jgi:AcrR family transcriptional regulator
MSASTTRLRYWREIDTVTWQGTENPPVRNAPEGTSYLLTAAGGSWAEYGDDGRLLSVAGLETGTWAVFAPTTRGGGLLASGIGDVAEAQNVAERHAADWTARHTPALRRLDGDLLETLSRRELGQLAVLDPDGVENATREAIASIERDLAALPDDDISVGLHRERESLENLSAEVRQLYARPAEPPVTERERSLMVTIAQLRGELERAASEQAAASARPAAGVSEPERGRGRPAQPGGSTPRRSSRGNAPRRDPATLAYPDAPWKRQRNRPMEMKPQEDPSSQFPSRGGIEL